MSTEYTLKDFRRDRTWFNDHHDVRVSCAERTEGGSGMWTGLVYGLKEDGRYESLDRAKEDLERLSRLVAMWVDLQAQKETI